MMNVLDRWNQEFFELRLSAEVLDLLKDLPNQNTEVHAFVERMFRFMKQAKFPAEDFSVLLGWAVGFLPSRILPSAWGGLIPPITIEGRHQKIDEYLSINPWRPLGPGSTLLDLGCGFPPRTSVDTSERHPEWRVIGADPSFGRYLLYDEQGNYACFREDQTIRYFQPSGMDLSLWDELFRDPEATMARFGALLKRLLDLHPDGNSDQLRVIEEGPVKLIEHPLKSYERPNLSFIEGGIGKVDVRDLDAVRCFNVLMYFDSTYRKNALQWIGEILKPGGLFICGLNWFKSTNTRYSVYRKESDRLAPREFAFSVENIRSLQIVSWFTMHDDDYETCKLAEVLSVIRSDSGFVRDFDKNMDQLQAENGICPRKEDGYLGGVVEGLTPAELEQSIAIIGVQLDARGFSERAAETLKQAGYNAWRNCVGHIAIAPFTS